MIGIPTDRDSHLMTEALTAIKVTASALCRSRLSGQEWPGGGAELVTIRSVDRGWGIEIGTDLPGAMESPIRDRHLHGSVATHAATSPCARPQVRRR